MQNYNRFGVDSFYMTWAMSIDRYIPQSVHNYAVVDWPRLEKDLKKYLKDSKGSLAALYSSVSKNVPVLVKERLNDDRYFNVQCSWTARHPEDMSSQRRAMRSAIDILEKMDIGVVNMFIDVP